VSNERPEGWWSEPSDPDVADSPSSTGHSEALLLLVVALGGALGTGARYGAGLAWPTSATAFPWITLLINVLGCALMGALMVLASERYTAPPMLRPFLGTGVLGGFTTFSAYAVDAERLFRLDAAGTALLSLVLTLVLAVAGVWAGASATRALTRRLA
jgi:CrcB protein